MYLTWFLITCVSCIFATEIPRPGEGNVVQVHAIFRHGERTPQDTYPKDPHINFSFYPDGWGQLTINGKRQALAQGRWLREHYGRVIGNLYSPKVVETRSTDVDRSIMSAQLALAGLFPPPPVQQFDESLRWQPAPVHTTPLHLDDLLLVRIPCPRYHEERNRILQEPPNTELLEKNAQLLAYLSSATGDNIRTLDDVQSLYSTLLAESRYNLTLPEWTYNVFPDRFINMTSYSFIVNVQTPLMRRLKAGPLVNKIYKQIKDRVDGKEAKKILLYSGHDSTVANLLSAFGALKAPYIPGYNALVLLELLEPQPGHFSVRLFRRSEEHPEGELLQVEGCEAECPLEDFTRLTENVRPSGWNSDCTAEDPNFRPPTPPPP